MRWDDRILRIPARLDGKYGTISGRQGEVAVILRGREGVGKGVFAKEFGDCLAPISSTS